VTLHQPAKRQVRHSRHGRENDGIVKTDRTDLNAHFLGTPRHCSIIEHDHIGFDVRCNKEIDVQGNQLN
jgi:hypothetical protein